MVSSCLPLLLAVMIVGGEGGISHSWQPVPLGSLSCKNKERQKDDMPYGGHLSAKISLYCATKKRNGKGLIAELE